MKVLSLSQPWASLLFLDCPTKPRKVKTWETRGWRPSTENHRKIISEGLLIHASATWKPEQKEIIKTEPFAPLLPLIEPMPFGAIIGWVKVGRILTTRQWLMEQPRIPAGQPVMWDNEVWFGDYSDGRYAWEIVEAKLFAQPITGVKGKLNLWNYEGLFGDNELRINEVLKGACRMFQFSTTLIAPFKILFNLLLSAAAVSCYKLHSENCTKGLIFFFFVGGFFVFFLFHYQLVTLKGNKKALKSLQNE